MKPPLLLVPGIDGTGKLFYRQIPGLERRFTVSTTRLRDDAVSMDDLVADLHGEVSRAVPDGARVALVGESFGGALTLSYALAHPERVERLVILNSFAYFTSPARLSLGYHLLRATPWPVMRMVRTLNASRMHSARTERDEIRRFHDLMRSTTREGYLSRLRILRQYDLRDRLPALAAPVLYLAADGDTLVPAVEQARLMSALSPRASMRVLEGHGHSCLIAPDLDLAAIIDDWLDRAGATLEGPEVVLTGPSRRPAPPEAGPNDAAANEAEPHASGSAGQRLRLVSIAQNAPGPAAVARLVRRGATAIKIEPPSGDALEALAKSWYDELHAGVRVERLDLKSRDGMAALKALLRDCDLFVASQRPAALARLGLDAASLARDYPALRHLNIVGDTAEPEHAGHDLTYQAQHGLVRREMPLTLVADMAGAERAYAAAIELMNDAPGSHRVVGLANVVHDLAAPLRHGLTSRGGPLGGGNPAYGLYAAREGMIAVAALEPHFRARLFASLGLAEGSDPSAAFMTKTALEWETWARPLDLPIVAVREIRREIRGQTPKIAPDER